MKQEKITPNKMDKKGDISTFVLVIGVFFVCAIAIFSFTFFKGTAEQKFDVLGNMAAVNSAAEQIRFYENAGGDMPDSLNVKKEAGYYNITSLRTKGSKQIFYVEYKMPLK
jgi:flagellar basal body-associated protein FliL